MRRSRREYDFIAWRLSQVAPGNSELAKRAISRAKPKLGKASV
jgi:hypothetical protein